MDPHGAEQPPAVSSPPGARDAGDARAELLAEKLRREHTLDLDGSDQ
jgi:hypothetical protein